MEKRIFSNITIEEEIKLTEGLTPIWLEENIPYFNKQDMQVLLNKLYEQNFEVYGIECFTLDDFEFVDVFVEELFITDFGGTEKDWHLLAFDRLIDRYNKYVAVSEPNNSPVFNVSFDRFDESNICNTSRTRPDVNIP